MYFNTKRQFKTKWEVDASNSNCIFVANYNINNKNNDNNANKIIKIMKNGTVAILGIII